MLPYWETADLFVRVVEHKITAHPLPDIVQWESTLYLTNQENENANAVTRWYRAWSDFGETFAGMHGLISGQQLEKFKI